MREFVEESDSSDGADFVFETFAGAELDAGLALGGFFRLAGSHQIGGAEVQVKAEFVVEILLPCVAPGEGAPGGAESSEHASNLA